MVIARKQTSGRGRFLRKWHSPEGGLWFSILIKNIACMEKIWNYYSGLLYAEVKFLKKFGIKATLKWPNDVLVKGKKISGILLESISRSSNFEVVIIGCGINLHNEIPEELSDKATNFISHCSKNTKLNKLIEEFFIILDKIFYQIDIMKIKFSEIVLNYFEGIGKRVTIISGKERFTGVIIGFTQKGEIIMKSKNIIKKFSTGELIDYYKKT